MIPNATRPQTQRSKFRLATKIALLGICPIIAAVAVILGTLFFRQKKLDAIVHQSVIAQAMSEARMLAKSAYLICTSMEMRNQKELTQSLEVARAKLAQAGGLALTEESISWQAVNQLSKETATISLPKATLGGNWLGQITAADKAVPLVDEIHQLTGNFCTIFQRMNDAGDMLRIGTSVLKDDGSRAIGTFIPAVGPDGVPNPITCAVINGETFKGRAFVVNDWHAATYEPIWNTAKSRVIGMIYVGVPLQKINKEVHNAITQMTLGKTGYVFAIGGKGTQRGQYIVSAQGKRDGENIWESRDADGNLFIQSIIAKGLATHDGASDFETYPWKNEGETKARLKTTAVTYYAPWDWIIGAGTYQDDYNVVTDALDDAARSMLMWVASIALAATVVTLVAGYFYTRTITGPLTRVATGLNQTADHMTASAGQISEASQALAEGSSEQAASLEETSSSLEEMSSMTKNNAESASRANTLARETRKAADAGTTDMQAMKSAMQDIKSSSDDISKIIKTIDEIAFQTNILALNAAVEAARAGEAGAGFAVVADEVRNLAQRSATAAKETATKIEGAINKTALGVQISNRVADSLGQIVTKVREVDTLISQVATASHEQNEGLQQINTAVSQMDKVVQSNAAAAEQIAAASNEMRVQSEALLTEAQGLTNLIGGQSPETPEETQAPVKPPHQNHRHPAVLRTPQIAHSEKNGSKGDFFT